MGEKNGSMIRGGWAGMEGKAFAGEGGGKGVMKGGKGIPLGGVPGILGSMCTEGGCRCTRKRYRVRTGRFLENVTVWTINARVTRS